jgi:hypothetical protein
MYFLARIHGQMPFRYVKMLSRNSLYTPFPLSAAFRPVPDAPANDYDGSGTQADEYAGQTASAGQRVSPPEDQPGDERTPVSKPQCLLLTRR